MLRVSQIVSGAALTSALALVVQGLCAGFAQANLIIDPGFETPVAANNVDTELPASQAGAAANPTYPWYDLINYAATTGATAFISSDIPPFVGNSSDRINSGTTGNKANSGDQYGYAYTVGATSGTVGGIGQLVTGITPGDSYVGSGFFFMKQNTSTDGDRFQANGSYDSLRMIFEDSTGTQIGSTVVSTLGGDSGKVDNTVTSNTWTQLSTAPTIAPAGASQVLFEMALTRGASGGVEFGDDADLEDVTPEPASLGLIASVGILALRRRQR